MSFYAVDVYNIGGSSISDGAWHQWMIETPGANSFPTGKECTDAFEVWLEKTWGVTQLINRYTWLNAKSKHNYHWFVFPSKEHAWRYFDFYKDKGMYYFLYKNNKFNELSKDGTYEEEAKVERYNSSPGTYEAVKAFLYHLAPEGVVPVVPEFPDIYETYVRCGHSSLVGYGKPFYVELEKRYPEFYAANFKPKVTKVKKSRMSIYNRNSRV